MSIYQTEFALDLAGIGIEAFNETAYIDGIHVAIGIDKRLISVTGLESILLRRRNILQTIGTRAYTIIVLDRISHPNIGGLSDSIIATVQSGTMTKSMTTSGLAVSMVGISGIATTSAGLSLVDTPTLPAASYTDKGEAVLRTPFYTSLTSVPQASSNNSDYEKSLPWMIGCLAVVIIFMAFSTLCLRKPKGSVIWREPPRSNNMTSLIVKPKSKNKKSKVYPVESVRVRSKFSESESI